MKHTISNKINLHLHTTLSDGLTSPCELLRIAQKEQLGIIAITDHDTIDGSREAIQNSQLFEGSIIPAVEINVKMTSECKMEILAYGIEFDNTELKKLFQDMDKSRRIRGKNMIKKLQSLGLNIQWNDILAIKSKGVIGRPHFAQALTKLGYCSSKRDAFNRYLNRGKPGYIPRHKLFADEIVKIIHQANGVAILAHPFLSYKNMAQFQDDLRLLLDAGLDGVELYYNYSHHFKYSSEVSIISTN